ncbi:MAG TPA: CdaR family protein [Methylomirabilota bacterium]|nr:CdaR family protein [Methylomirabilota bacterium]
MRDFLTKDLGWKIASVALAVVIWVTVYKYESPTEHGVTVENTYGDLSVVAFSATGDPRAYQIAPDTVSVKVSGPEKLMNQLQGNQIHPFVDLTGAESAKGFRLSVNVALPKGVTLDDVDPPWIGVMQRH